jgi:hypothetical protein
MADPSETTQVSREPAQEELVEAIHSLSSQVERLQADVQALRSEGRGLPSGETDHHGWDDGAPMVRDGPAWVRSVDSPRSRGLSIPWLLLEIVFLVAVAVLAVVADLEPYAIAGVMAAAWALVAIGEWFAARSARSQQVLVYGSSSATAPPVPDDHAWFATNGDDTLLDAPSAERAPARLPPPE